MGPRAQAAAAKLHYDDGIPQRKVPRVLRSLTGLSVTQGALAQSAIRLGTGQGAVARRYQQLRKEIETEVSWHLRPRQLTDSDNQRLLNELGRHHNRGNLLRFLHEPTTVSPTNNAAERALRSAVIARKVSHCSKSDAGAEAYEAFKSVLGSLKKKGGDVLEKLVELIAPPPQTPASENAS